MKIIKKYNQDINTMLGNKIEKKSKSNKNTKMKKWIPHLMIKRNKVKASKIHSKACLVTKLAIDIDAKVVEVSASINTLLNGLGPLIILIIDHITQIK